MSQQIRGHGGHLVLGSARKTNPLSGFRGEAENVSANQRPGRPSCFLDRGSCELASSQEFVEFHLAVSKDKLKM